MAREGPFGPPRYWSAVRHTGKDATEGHWMFHRSWMTEVLVTEGCLQGTLKSDLAIRLEPPNGRKSGRLSPARPLCK